MIYVSSLFYSLWKIRAKCLGKWIIFIIIVIVIAIFIAIAILLSW